MKMRYIENLVFNCEKMPRGKAFWRMLKIETAIDRYGYYVSSDFVKYSN